MVRYVVLVCGVLGRGLDYAHGTGHGVGAFLNVHEGPHGISRARCARLSRGARSALPLRSRSFTFQPKLEIRMHAIWQLGAGAVSGHTLSRTTHALPSLVVRRQRRKGLGNARAGE